MVGHLPFTAGLATVPSPRRPPDATASGDDPVRRWYENELGWPTVPEKSPGSCVRIRVGLRFDVLDIPAAAGHAALRHLTAGSPVAVRGDRLLLLVAAGSAEELPGILEWLEWGTLPLDLRALGPGDSMEAPAPPRPPARLDTSLLPEAGRDGPQGGTGCGAPGREHEPGPDGRTERSAPREATGDADGDTTGVVEAVRNSMPGRPAGPHGRPSEHEPDGSRGQWSAHGPDGSDGRPSALGPGGSLGRPSALGPDGSRGQRSELEPDGSGERPAASGTGRLMAAEFCGGGPGVGVRPLVLGRPGALQGAAVWLRPPEPGCEVEASLPTMSALGGVGGPPDLVRVVNTVATQCHRLRLRARP
ncbi:SCO3374 family protein [Streptomyces griseorubiginosus]|uniref:SCO3374 family protein n=1 Tax=Streptomyces griseorubiginosus TaxID=67304 RepID=UPI0036EA21D8